MKKKPRKAVFGAGQGTLVLLRRQGSSFRISGELPNWFVRLFPGRFADGDAIDVVDIFAFMEIFLEEAASAWSGDASLVAESEVWTQVMPDGSELQLAATAATVDNCSVLLIRSDVGDWHEKRGILQTARENTLEHERLVRAEHMLAQSQMRLRLVLSHLPALVWTADRELKVNALYGSPEHLHALSQLLKSPIDQLVGKPIGKLFGEDDLSASIPGAHRLAVEGICVDFELQVGALPLDCHLEPLHDIDGTVSGLIGIGRDISQQREVENERILAAQREERAAVAESHVQELRAEIAARMEVEHRLKDALGTVARTLESAIVAMARALETRDSYTAGHQQRVARLSREIAREIGLSEEIAHQVYLTGLIHDLGKIAVPFEILGKPGHLSPPEFALVRLHPVCGYDILSSMDFPWPVAKIVRQHHECLDGSGYPDGLKGDEIMLEARIISVADIIESVGSHRPYRPSLGMDAAFKIVLDGRGTRYDPVVVDTCVRLIGEKGFRFE